MDAEEAPFDGSMKRPGLRFEPERRHDHISFRVVVVQR
jgi:hypothetical protein